MAVDEIVTGTSSASYAERLERLESAWWKRWLDVQAPYRWNIRRLNLGRTLDLGCGVGRNLSHLDGNGIGVDHNTCSVAKARARGLEAYSADEFRSSRHARAAAFDSLLLAHVLEHLEEETATSLVSTYLEFVRPKGKAVFICPQERGFASDATHVRFCGPEELRALSESVGLTIERQFSFPLPRLAGRIFAYNEFVTVARLP